MGTKRLTRTSSKRDSERDDGARGASNIERVIERVLPARRAGATRHGGPRRERNAEQTRARIVRAAEAEFASKGFDGARLGNIARAAEVQQALIHHYFGDKEGLHREVLRGGLEAMTKGVWELLARMEEDERGAAKRPRRTARELRAIAEGFVELVLRFFAENGSFLAILRHEAQRGDLTAAIVGQAVRPMFDAIVEKLRQMQKAGEVRKDVDARHLILSAVGMAAFPFLEEPFVAAIWEAPVHDAAFFRARRDEIVAMILARVLDR